MDEKLDGLRHALRIIIRYAKPDCPLRRVQVLLRVHQLQTATLAEIERLVKAPAGTVYWDLKALGEP